MNTNLLLRFFYAWAVLFIFSTENIAQPSAASDNSFQNQKMVLPPSPNAASLGQFGEYEVSHYTGAVNLSVPIYSLQGSSIGHGISLSYNSASNKVESIPSWTGLGWNLNAGGVVSRTVMGNPDIFGNYYNNTFGGFNDETLCLSSPMDLINNYPLYQLADCGDIETKPDIYNLSVGGISATFIITPGTATEPSRVITRERTGLEITPNFSNQELVSFRVVDQTGVEYIFQTAERSQHLLAEVAGVCIPEFWYNSSWFLTRITSPNMNERIDFQYSTEFPCRGNRCGNGYQMPINPSKYQSYKHVSTLTNGGPATGQSPCGNSGMQTSVFNGEIKIYNKRTLSKIILNTKGYIESVDFIAKPHDYNIGIAHGDKKLTQIIRKNSNNQGMVDWDFGYDDSSGRLTLKSITEKESGGGISKPSYTFSYIGGKLPSVISNAQDHWGYYNGAVNNASLVPNIEINGQVVGGGASREPNFSYAKRGLLEQITYPTGGTSKFWYEPNKTTEGFVGGMRVYKAQNKDTGGGAIDTKEFSYTQKNNGSSSGRLFTRVDYTDSYDFEHKLCILQGDFEYSCRYTTISGANVNPLRTAKGSHIGYGTVHVKQVVEGKFGIGKTTYSYINGPVGTTDYLGATNNGDLIEIEVKDAGGQVVQTTTNSYSSNVFDDSYVIRGIKRLPLQNDHDEICKFDLPGGATCVSEAQCASNNPPVQCCSDGCGYGFQSFCNRQREDCVDFFYLGSNTTKYTTTVNNVNQLWRHLSSSSTTEYFNSGNVVSTQQYEYANPHITSPTKTSISGGGVSYTTEIKYPHDIAGPSAAVIAMRDQFHMRAIPIETLKKSGNTLINGTETEFCLHSITGLAQMRPLPKVFKHKYSGSSDVIVGTVTSYDGHGNVEGYQRYTSNDFYPETYQWNAGRLQSTTVNTKTRLFTYHDNTRYPHIITEIDGNQTRYEFDGLWRLEDMFARGGGVHRTLAKLVKMI